MNFFEKLNAAMERCGSPLCVGLDPRADKLPPGAEMEMRLLKWGQGIIEKTADLVCCYKPNFAFYEQSGPEGLRALKATIRSIPAEIPVLLDVKRGDIGSTATAYAVAAYEIWGADAVTLNPYLGEDGVRSFIDYAGKAAFILCYTSNPSAGQIQEHGYPPLYEHVALQACKWGDENQIGLVVGATQPRALRRVRQLCSRHWILAPGVGAQGGDLEDALRAGLRQDGKGLIIPVSRGVIFEPDARQAASELRAKIQTCFARVQPEQDGFERRELSEALFKAGCVRFGEFTLASGARSPIYIDLRRAVSFPDLFNRMARAYTQRLVNISFDHIACVPYAALPIGAVVAASMQASLIYPRKEVKDHGTIQRIEGSFQHSQRAVLIEDVVTSGGSVISAAETLREAGLVVSDAVVLVDRQQGGADRLAKAGIHLHAVMDIGGLLDDLRAAGLIDAPTYALVKEYLNDNCVH